MTMSSQSTMFVRSKIQTARDCVVDWMVGKRLNLPVVLMQPPNEKFGLPECFLETKDNQGASSFHPFRPTKDWRITGQILQENPMVVEHKRRNMCTTSDITVSFIDNKGEEKEVTSSYSVISAIAKAFVLYVGDEESEKLYDQAEEIYDKLRGFKTSQK